MTLEETTGLVMAAAELQDPGALEAAGKEREAAIAVLHLIPATPQLCDAVMASIEAGEEAKRVIRLIKHRARNESRRLDRIEQGFVRALGHEANHWIDYQG